MERSLIAQRDRLFREADEGEQVTWADALLALAAGGRSRSDLSTVLVHLRPVADEAPTAHLHGGPALPDSLRRYLSCDKSSDRCGKPTVDR